MNYEKMTLAELKRNLKKEFPIILDEETEAQVLNSMGEDFKSTLLSFKKPISVNGFNSGDIKDGLCVPCSSCRNINVVEKDDIYSDIHCQKCDTTISLTYRSFRETSVVHIYHKDKNIYSVHSVFGEIDVNEEGDIDCRRLSIRPAFAVWYLDNRGFFYNIKGLNQVNTEKSINNDIRGFDSMNFNMLLGYKDIPKKNIDFINSLLEITNKPKVNSGNFISSVITSVKNINKMRLIEEHKAEKAKKENLLNKLKDNIKSDEELFEIIRFKDDKLIHTTHTKIGTKIGVYVYCPDCQVVNDLTLEAVDSSFALECCNTVYDRAAISERSESSHRCGVDSIIHLNETYYKVNNSVSIRIDSDGELLLRNKVNSIEKLSKYPKLNDLNNASNKIFKSQYLYSEKISTSKSNTVITKEDLLKIFDFFDIKNREDVYNLIYKQYEKETIGNKYVVFDVLSIYNIGLNKILAYYPNIVETIGLKILSELDSRELSLLVGYPSKDLNDFQAITGMSEEIFYSIYNSELREILGVILEINSVKTLATEDVEVFKENIDILRPLNGVSYGSHTDFFRVLNALIDANQCNFKRLLNRIRYYAEDENLLDNDSYHFVYRHYSSYLADLISNIEDGLVEVDDNIYYPQNLKLNMHKQRNLRNINYDVGLENNLHSHKVISYKEDDIEIKSILNMRHAMDIEKDFTKPFGFLMLDNDYRNLMYVSKNNEIIAILVGSYARFSKFDLLRIIPKNNLTKKDRRIINNFAKKHKGDM